MEEFRARYERALKRGNSYSWEQRWPEAIAEFEKAIDAVADQPAPYAGLGAAYFEMGDLVRALDNYKLAARYSQGDMIYLKHVADVQERLGHLTEAGQTYLALGEIQLRRRKLDDAVGNWLRAVRLEPDLLGGHQRLAAVYRRQGLVNNAIREYLAMARIYHLRGDDEKAIKTCEMALELDPSNADVLTALDLIRQGEELIPDPSEFDSEPEPVSVDEPNHGDTVQRITTILEADRASRPQKEANDTDGLMNTYLHIGQQQLAQAIFLEEDESLTATVGLGVLSKLERDALISQALDFQTRNMVNEAIDCFEKAISGGVTDLAAHFCLGALYLLAQQPKNALNELSLNLESPKFRVAAHYAMGETYELRSDLYHAIGHYIAGLKYIDLESVEPEKVERVNEMYNHLTQRFGYEAEPEDVSNFISGLKEFLNSRNWQDKVTDARLRLEQIATDGQTLILGDILAAGSLQVLESLHLSQVYEKESKYDSAVEEAYRAIQLSPFYLSAHIQLAELLAKQDRNQIAVNKFLTIGDTYQVRGDINSAIENYERAVEIAPMELSVRGRLIDVLVQQGKIEQALQHYIEMGEHYYNFAEIDKARETYLEALQVVPSVTSDQEWRLLLLQRIADIDMQRLDWKRALIAYQEISAAKPEDETIALTLVDLYYKAGQPDKALSRLDSLLIHLVRSGQQERVTQILKDLVENRPSDVGLADRLSRLYLHQGHKQDAIALLDRVGEAQLDAGQVGRAAETVQRILQLDPPNAASYRLLLQRLQKSAIN